MRHLILAATVLLAVSSAPAIAQDAVSNQISIAPIGAIFGVYNAEFETGITPNVTGAIGGTYWGFEDDAIGSSGSAEAHVSYVSTDVKARFYPDAALDGFSFGALAGATSVGGGASACTTDPTTGVETCDEAGARAWALSAGVELDYNFLLGDEDNFAVVAGLGGKRLLPLSGDIDTLLGYPFGRLSVGYAF